MTQVQIQARYQTRYDRIVKPGQAFLVPNYFIKYWGPLLGPNLCWITISLQQAIWRSDHDWCRITQEAIGQEIGLERKAVMRAFNNKYSHWLIPSIKHKNYKNRIRLPKQYEVYASSPLTPRHLSGVAKYFALNKNNLQTAIEHLLAIKSKDALAIIESYSLSQKEADTAFKSSVPITELLNRPNGTIRDLAEQLQTHLTGGGKTLLRQYFRKVWVPLLGPSRAWLIMNLRSRCYYNPVTDETRDTNTWGKGELMQTVGQTTDSLRKGFLTNNECLARFIQIQKTQTREITIRVEMKDPIHETKETEEETRKNGTDSLKYLKETVPLKESIPLKQVREALSVLSLSSTSLFFEKFHFSEAQVKALRHPPDLPALKAIGVYALLNNQGAECVCTCILKNKKVTQLYLDLVDLEEDTVALFEEAVRSIREGGPVPVRVYASLDPRERALFEEFINFVGRQPCPAQAVWESTLEVWGMTKATYNAHFLNSRGVVIEEDTLIVSVKESSLTWAQGRLGESANKIASSVTDGRITTVKFTSRKGVGVDP